MRTDPQLIREWIEGLNESGCLVVVEGVKDRRALQATGVTARIMTLSRRAIYRIVEDVVASGRDVVILTDIDAHGKRLYRLMVSELSQRGVRVDRKYREFLQTETPLDQIEGIRRYAQHCGLE
ncbi:MAG: hypothetical protein ABIH41_03075 [Nanoarchaeota archaeon]